MLEKNQAVLISAYKDFDTLLVLLRYYNQHYSCYVHIDKKVKIPDGFMRSVKELTNVSVYSQYRINWGSYKHILAFIKMLSIAVNDGCDYFHILPANAFPVKSMAYMSDFYNKNSSKCFIEMDTVSEEGIVADRQRYFYAQHLYDLKTDRGYSTEQKFLTVQKKLHIKRPIIFRFKGYLYCHLSKEAAQYVLKYIKTNRWYLRKLKTMSIPEEFFFQNIVANSPFRNDVVNNNMFFDDWHDGAGGPAVLTESQLDEAVQSDRLFARKIESPTLGKMLLESLYN